MVTDFTQLDVWKKSMDLAVQIHGITKRFSREEIYAVTSQLRRALLSVSANIAEGFGRFTAPDKKHKYIQARGELIETITFLHYCHRVSYITKLELDIQLSLCKDVHQMLNALIGKIRERDA